MLAPAPIIHLLDKKSKLGMIIDRYHHELNIKHELRVYSWPTHNAESTYYKDMTQLELYCTS